MIISPLPILNDIKNFQYQKRVFSFKSDTFERTSNPDSEAVKFLKSTNFVKSGLKKVLADPSNELGCGIYHKVYSIPDCNDYVLRVPKDFNLSDINLNDFTIEDTEDKNLKINIGQEIAKINFKTPKDSSSISLLKKQNGQSVGIAPLEVFEQIYDNDSDLISVYTSQEMKKTFADSLSLLASFPVSSYEKLTDDVKSAADCGYFFDYKNSNNIMADKKTKSLNLTDMVKCDGCLNWGSVLFALTNIKYMPAYINAGYKINEDDRKKASENVQCICDKYIQALKNKGISEDEQQQCLLTFFSMFMGSFFPSNKL